MSVRIEFGRGFPCFVVQGREASRAAEFISHISGVRVHFGYVSFPLETRLLELVLRYTGAELAEDAKVWYDGQIEKEKNRTALMSLEDLQLSHPKAHLLWPFQRVGANFLVKLRKAVLGDVCGLGKTATAIIASELSRWHERTLILCPNSLKHWWASQIECWSSDRHQVYVVDSQSRGGAFESFRFTQGWLIVNYELTFRSPQLEDILFDWIICDEAHRMKNRKTKTFQAVKKLRCRRMALLTGTPYGNDPSELWSLLNLLGPERYTSFWRFYEMYVDYTEDYWGGRKIRGVRNAELLRRELSTIMARRSKEEVLSSLPEKMYQTIPLEMLPEQKRIYKKASKEALIELEGGESIEIPNMISMITRLRQILSTPYAFGLETLSCKVEAVMDLISSTDEKLVVLTQFRSTAMCISGRLHSEGVGHSLAMGGLDVDKAVRQFQNEPGCKVFVGTAATGGVGLTLTASRTIVFVEKHWNPAQQGQAEDRVHRIGQTRGVHIIDLFCPGTVDELVEKILQRKIQMIAAVLKDELVKVLEDWS